MKTFRSRYNSHNMLLPPFTLINRICRPSLEELVSLFEPIEDPHDNEGFVYDFQSTDAICWTSDDDDDEESHSETANNV